MSSEKKADFSRLPSVGKIEFNFVGKKFLQLSKEEQERLYLLIQTDNEETFIESARFLFELLNNNSKELAQEFGFLYQNINVITFPGEEDIKAKILWLYFRENLVETEDGFSIPPIE